jgi:chromosome segregation ATPase
MTNRPIIPPLVTDHSRIWLEPHIGRSEDRLWCQDKAWEDGTEYVRADLAEPYFSKELHEEGCKALARVTKERDDLIEAQRVSEADMKVSNDEHAALLADWTEAKAELEEWRRDYDRGTKMSDLSAEVRSEINHWRGRAEQAEAEIARLQRENSDLNYNIVGMRSSNTNLVAEIGRLRKVFGEYVRVTTPLLSDSKALAAAVNALKPDTGETP